MAKKKEPSEQELLDLNIGIVPAIDNYKNISPFPVGTIKFIDDQALVYKHEHVDHYMNEVVMARTLALGAEDKERYFQMINDYADILIKIVGDDNHVIWKAALGVPFEDLQNHAKKSGAIIDYTKPEQLLKRSEEHTSELQSH